MRQIPQFPDYYIDDQGNFWSHKRQPRKLSPITSCTHGYVAYNFSIAGKVHSVTAHRLIYQMYCNGGVQLDANLVINHKDGNKHNNSPSNLELVDQQQNCIHAFDIGLNKNHNKSHWAAKLTYDQIEEIRRVYIPRHREFGGSALARQYGVCQAHISKIVLNQSRTRPPTA